MASASLGGKMEEGTQYGRTCLAKYHFSLCSIFKWDDGIGCKNRTLDHWCGIENQETQSKLDLLQGDTEDQWIHYRL